MKSYVPGTISTRVSVAFIDKGPTKSMVTVAPTCISSSDMSSPT